MRRLKDEVTNEQVLYLKQMHEVLAGLTAGGILSDPPPSRATCGANCMVTCAYYCRNNCEDTCRNECVDTCKLGVSREICFLMIWAPPMI